MKTIAAIGFAAFVGFASGCADAAPPDTQAMFQTATGFYGVYLTLHPSDGIPDAALRARFEPFISPALDKLLADGDTAEERYVKATKNQAPPLVEGDLFSPNFEGITSLKIGTCAADAKGGHCPVAMVYDDGKDKPVKWTDTIVLVNTAAGWRVDDVAYGTVGDFGNRGSLTGTLHEAIRDGNSIPN
ncbi:MAG: hypothetical protein ABSC92_00085 [Rhizomicrobium sp.]|jgi:hypothetical protein